MDFELNEEQRLMSDTVERFLNERYTFRRLTVIAQQFGDASRR